MAAQKMREQSSSADIEGNLRGKMVRRMKRSHKHNKEMEALDLSDPWPLTPEEELVKRTKNHPGFTRHFIFPSSQEGWVTTKRGHAISADTPERMLSLDCEMVECEDGSREVVRVCIIDRDCNKMIDVLVKPSKSVRDFKTEFSGLTAKDLEGVTVSQSDIQKEVKSFLTPGTILVGHSLHYDLAALKIDHRRLIDTGYIFRVRNRHVTFVPSLRDLCKFVLGYDFRHDGAPHNCLDDATVPMKLVLHCLAMGGIPIVALPQHEVDKSNFSKLFLHRVPLDIPAKSLESLFPRKLHCELQNGKKSDRATSTHTTKVAAFRSKEVANCAFESLQGELGEDICGRPQKKVFISNRTHIMVRKMVTAEEEQEFTALQAQLVAPGLAPALNKDKDIAPVAESAKSLADEEKGDCQASKDCDSLGVQMYVEKRAAPSGVKENKKRTKKCSCSIGKEVLGLQKKLQEQSEEVKSLRKIVTALTRKQSLV